MCCPSWPPSEMGFPGHWLRVPQIFRKRFGAVVSIGFFWVKHGRLMKLVNHEGVKDIWCKINGVLLLFRFFV